MFKATECGSLRTETPHSALTDCNCDCKRKALKHLTRLVKCLLLQGAQVTIQKASPWPVQNEPSPGAPCTNCSSLKDHRKTFSLAQRAALKVAFKTQHAFQILARDSDSTIFAGWVLSNPAIPIHSD